MPVNISDLVSFNADQPLSATQKAQLAKNIGGWEPIGLVNMAGLTVANVLNLSPFVLIRCTYQFLAPIGAAPLMYASTNNGTSFLTSSTDYRYCMTNSTFTGTTSVTGTDENIAGISLGAEYTGGVVTFTGFNKPRLGQLMAHQLIDTSTVRYNRTISHRIESVTARNALRISTSTAFTYGEFFFEGVRG